MGCPPNRENSTSALPRRMGTNGEQLGTQPSASVPPSEELGPADVRGLGGGWDEVGQALRRRRPRPNSPECGLLGLVAGRRTPITCARFHRPAGLPVSGREPLSGSCPSRTRSPWKRGSSRSPGQGHREHLSLGIQPVRALGGPSSTDTRPVRTSHPSGDGRGASPGTGAAAGPPRVQCDGVAFSCKGRGVCPSSNARCMAEVTTHLTDEVIPHLPVRQWVLSVPKHLRPFFHQTPEVASAVLAIFLRALRAALREASPGATTAQRADDGL